MTTSTELHTAIKAALADGDVNAVDGPAHDLPRDASGRIEQAAVLWPSPRLNVHARMVGSSSGGADRVVITCVGATTYDALAVADKVHAALDGLVLSAKGGPLRQTAVTAPAPEVNADPVRVSLGVEYATITKG